jgi:C-terminal processing protease CtpA/Prc
MRTQWLGLLVLAAAALFAQPPTVSDAALSFEVSSGDALPAEWRGGPPETLALDRETFRSGRSAARIRRTGDSADVASALTATIPIDFSGTTVEVRGFLRTDAVVGAMGLWIREDGAGGTMQFNNMGQQQIDGTRDWTEYRLTLPLVAEARVLHFGAWLSGTGTVWADDLELFVDGRPLRDAPKVVREPTILETDREFTEGSGVNLTMLTDRHVEDLAVLARVWGFLKHHHPRIAAGELHWDYELFRVLPAVLAAPTAAARNAALFDWGRRIGEPEACATCATVPQDAQLFADVAWIRDTASLGADLSRYLENVYRNRPASGEQFYAGFAPNVGNPTFENELAYQGLATPDSGYRLLALFRFWNVIEYWFPNRDVIGEPWPDVLTELLPRFAAAATRETYALELARLVTRINDTHTFLGGADGFLPPRGACQVPVALRFVEGQATVGAFNSTAQTSVPGLAVGDVVIAVDAVPVERLIAERAPYHPASNDAAKLQRIALNLTRGACGPTTLTVTRGAENVDVAAERVPLASVDRRVPSTHDRAGDTFQWLGDDVAYVKLSSIKRADVKSYIETAAGARGLIVDIRNYPSEFVVFALSGHFLHEPTEFVAFSAADRTNPGTFAWVARPTLQPLEPRYSGRVVILVDEATISQAEYTAMALRATPNAVVIGSTTQGADGNVSQLPLPGGFSTAFSGLGVFYPDHAPTQRVGIVPDVFVEPTVAGIRAGRDEVLERALEEIRGD